MESYSIYDVFTPASSAIINFIERKELNERFVTSLQTPGKQLIVYGHSGSGKTTLIDNKLVQTHERHIKTSCTVDMTYENVLLHAFDKIAPYFDHIIETNSEKEKNSSIGVSFKTIKAEISEKQKTGTKHQAKRALPLQLTHQNLAEFMGVLNCCWVLEDFHKLKNMEKLKLSQMMKVFMDMSSKYRDLKIIFVGAVDSARQVVNFDSEMRNRVAQIRVPLMAYNEVKELINNGFELLNIKKISAGVYKEIFDYSTGHPSICHNLCLDICHTLGINQTLTNSNILTLLKHEDDLSENKSQESSTEMELLRQIFKKDLETDSAESTGITVRYEHLEAAKNKYLQDEEDNFRCVFERGFNVKKGPLAIESLSELDKNGADIKEIFQNAKEIDSHITIRQIEKALHTLKNEDEIGLIIHSQDSNSYRFSNLFFRTYASMFFESLPPNSSRKKRSDADYIKLLNSNLKN